MFLADLWGYLYGYKELFIITVLLVIASAIILPAMIKKFKYAEGKNAVLYFLYGRSTREIAYISLVIAEVLFVLSCIFFQYRVNLLVVVIIAIMEIAIAVTGYNWKLIFMEIISTVFFVVSLFFAYMMKNYLDEIQADISVSIICFLLYLMIGCYAIFFLVWHMIQLGDRKSVNKKSIEGKENNGKV